MFASKFKIALAISAMLLALFSAAATTASADGTGVTASPGPDNGCCRR